MCLASKDSRCTVGRTTSSAKNSDSWRTAGGGVVGSHNKILGMLLTSLVALSVGMSRFNMAIYIDQSSKPLACGLLVILAIRKLRKFIQNGKNQVGSLMENCTQKVDDVMMRVSSNSTLTRIKSSVSASSMRLIDLATGRGETRHEKFHENRFEKRSPKIAVLHAPFLSLETTNKLSLGDIKNLFRYALEVNRSDFDKESFLSKVNHVQCYDAILSMDHAVLAAREGISKISVPLIHESGPGASEMDALYFVAMVCIFAEWRSLRLVPPGHPRYTVGMGLARRDLLQNAQKIETAVQHYLFSQEQKRLSYCPTDMISSPTLRQLMLWEIERNLHPRLPKVREKSGASGLIWICRQLKYQNLIFQNILRVPLVYPTAKSAVTAAYTATYDAYHGFLVKHVFLSSFDAAPSADEILNHMIPAQVLRDVVETFSNDSAVMDMTTNHSIDRDCSLIKTTTMTARNPIEFVANHFLSEWMRFERFLNQCNGVHAKSSASRNGLLLPTKGCSLIDLRKVPLFDAPNDHNNVCTTKDSVSSSNAKEEIASFSATMQPILNDLDKLIRRLNVDDPTKC